MKTYLEKVIREQDTEKLLGFVMINTFMHKSSNGHSIVEFMVIPKYTNNNFEYIDNIFMFNSGDRYE